MYVYNNNSAKTAHHIIVFIIALYLKMFSGNKAILQSNLQQKICRVHVYVIELD